MASAKKKATAKPGVRFKDLKSRTNPKGGWSGSGGGGDPSRKTKLN
jgi:hypothetical protein